MGSKECKKVVSVSASSFQVSSWEFWAPTCLVGPNYGTSIVGFAGFDSNRVWNRYELLLMLALSRDLQQWTQGPFL